MLKLLSALRFIPKFMRALPLVTGWLHKKTDGKKTLTGLISLGLWVLIYALPALYPESNTAQIGQYIADFLKYSNVPLDYDLLAGGATLTVVGLLHKSIKTFTRKENTNGKTISKR